MDKIQYDRIGLKRVGWIRKDRIGYNESDKIR